MRDTIKDRFYFEKLINSQITGIEKFYNWIEIGKTPKERINIVKQEIAKDYIYLIVGKYSAGFPQGEMNIYLKKAIAEIYESWDGFWKLKNENGEEYDQYILSAYDEMLWVLSLGYLLDVDEADFSKLVEVIDRDGVKDFLFEFIIGAKVKDRKQIQSESYQEYFGVPKVFEKLRQAIAETEKDKAEKLVKEFITKDWYKNHKDSGWYNSHKSKHDSYFGYWSFETAAVVKIMGLDDSGFKDSPYYPRDLVKG